MVHVMSVFKLAFTFHCIHITMKSDSREDKKYHRQRDTSGVFHRFPEISQDY